MGWLTTGCPTTTWWSPRSKLLTSPCAMVLWETKVCFLRKKTQINKSEYPFQISLNFRKLPHWLPSPNQMAHRLEAGNEALAGLDDRSDLSKKLLQITISSTSWFESWSSLKIPKDGKRGPDPTGPKTSSVSSTSTSGSSTWAMTSSSSSSSSACGRRVILEFCKRMIE